MTYAKPSEGVVGAALKTDPLHDAEQITGKSYKDDKATAALGFLMNAEHAENKRAILAEHGDTHHQSTLVEYREVLDELGFITVEHRVFPYEEDRFLEHFLTYHPDGLVLSANSWEWTNEVPKINDAKVWYNWKPSEVYWALLDEAREKGDYDLAPPHVTSSGHYTWPDGPEGWRRSAQNEELIWVGDHDAREGIRHNLGQLRKWGDFVNPWVEQPFAVTSLDLVERKAFFDDFDVTTHREDVASHQKERFPQVVLDIVGTAYEG